MSKSQILSIANMYFKAIIHENKILAKISESTVSIWEIAIYSRVFIKA